MQVNVKFDIEEFAKLTKPCRPPALLRLSRAARRAVVQNLVLATLAILGLVAWDLLGTLPLPLGVLGHEGGTVLIALNGLRLLRKSAWRP